MNPTATPSQVPAYACDDAGHMLALLPGSEPFRHDGGRTGVLLCHGFTGSPQSMRPWAEHLAHAGLSVELPLLPGHGTRWQDLNRTGWPDWYEEAERAFDRLLARCTDVFVMGLSMGGTLAVRLAEQRGAQVAGIVVVNPSLHSERKELRLLPVLKHLVPSARGIGGDIQRSGVAETGYPRTPLRALDSLRELWRLTSADLRFVIQPLLVYRSRVDHVVEPSNSRALLAGVSSYDVEERILEESYHVATLDNDAARIFAGSLDFVRRIQNGRTPASAGESI